MSKEIKNYYGPKERRFTILKLEIRKLSTSDILILSGIGLLFAVYYFFGHIREVAKWSWVGLGVSSTFLVFTTPFGLRFRSVIFSIIWLVYTLICFFKFIPITAMPLLIFLFYHILRWIFWLKYDMEFIPFEVNRSGYQRYVSKIEGRGGYKRDKVFMKILFWGGIIIFFSCLFASVGTKLL